MSGNAGAMVHFIGFQIARRQGSGAYRACQQGRLARLRGTATALSVSGLLAFGVSFPPQAMAQNNDPGNIDAPFIPQTERLEDDDDPAAGDADAQLAQEPANGLPPLREPEEPGDRFRTASQIRADQLTEAQREALERFAIPNGTLLDDDVLVTGAIGDETDDDDVLLDPFEPLGLRAGPLIWFPAIDLAAGYDSNPGSVVDGREVRTLRIAPQLRLETDWRRHGFEGEVIGSAQLFDDARDTEFDLNAEAALRLDVARDSTLTFRGSYAFDPEQESDENAPATASGVTDTHEITGGVTAARQFGIVNVEVGGQVGRFLFSDTPLADGSRTDNGDRNRYEFTGDLRLERTEGPLLRPFAETGLTLRRFDDDLDRNGLNRDSLSYRASLGLNLADDKPLRGSVSIGIVGEDFEDDAIEDVVSFAAQAALTWDVTSLTSATLNIATDLDPTTQANSGIEITRSADVDVTHDLRQNLELRLGAGISDSEFSGVDTNTRTYTGRAGLTWRTSRTLAFRLDGTYERESRVGDDIDRFTVEAGVTLRR